MYHFATLFDINYLSRGMALYQSMQRNIDDFVLYVLALDQKAFEYVENSGIDNLKAISLSEIEDTYPELIEAKKNRSIVEYYFTLSPVLPLYMLEVYPEIDFITTLDSDILFFSSPKTLFDEFSGYSIMITAHDFSESLDHLNIWGKYNVSFQSFRNNDIGLTCLKRWKTQCIDWCYDRLEDNRFADQKYLDTWKNDYQGVLEIIGKGAGIAPWNVAKYKVEYRNKITYCNNDVLIFFHFHGFRFVNPHLVKHDLNLYQVRISASLKNHIYGAYIKQLSEIDSSGSFTEKGITRISIPKSNKEIFNLIMAGNIFCILFNKYLINIRLPRVYKALKFSVYLPVLIFKRLAAK